MLVSSESLKAMPLLSLVCGCSLLALAGDSAAEYCCAGCRLTVPGLAMPPDCWLMILVLPFVLLPEGDAQEFCLLGGAVSAGCVV